MTEEIKVRNDLSDLIESNQKILRDETIPLDHKTVLMALNMKDAADRQKDPLKFICEVGWTPLALLHDLMVEQNQIPGLRQIGSDQKLRLWTLACVGRPEGSKFKRISISKAILMYEIINEGFGRVTE